MPARNPATMPAARLTFPKGNFSLPPLSLYSITYGEGNFYYLEITFLRNLLFLRLNKGLDHLSAVRSPKLPSQAPNLALAAPMPELSSAAALPRLGASVLPMRQTASRGAPCRTLSGLVTAAFSVLRHLHRKRGEKRAGEEGGRPRAPGPRLASLGHAGATAHVRSRRETPLR